MNPIYIEYYVHEGCDCYKIDDPWTRYAAHKHVLCRVDEGLPLARLMAVGVVNRSLSDALTRSIKGTET